MWSMGMVDPERRANSGEKAVSGRVHPGRATLGIALLRRLDYNPALQLQQQIQLKLQGFNLPIPRPSAEVAAWTPEDWA